MSSVKSAVIDTNIFVSTLRGSNTCERIYELLKRGKLQTVLSTDLLAELADVLQREKFGFSADRISRFLSVLSRYVTIVCPTHSVAVSRDPDDDIVLECAFAGKVDFIVTGDKDLLTLRVFENIPIIPPRQFLEKIR